MTATVIGGRAFYVHGREIRTTFAYDVYRTLLASQFASYIKYMRCFAVVAAFCVSGSKGIACMTFTPVCQLIAKTLLVSGSPNRSIAIEVPNTIVINKM